MARKQFVTKIKTMLENMRERERLRERERQRETEKKIDIYRNKEKERERENEINKERHKYWICKYPIACVVFLLRIQICTIFNLKFE